MRIGMNPLIGGGLLLVSFIALSLTVFINLHKFDSAFDDTVNDRFYFILEEVRDVIEGEMRLGQPISQLKTASLALNSAKEIDPYILSIEIFNDESRTLYSTDNSFLFDLVPSSWDAARKASSTGHWKLVEDGSENGAIVLGVEVQDALLQPAGSIVLRYSDALHSNTLQKISSKLIETAFLFWISAAVIVFLIVFYLTRPLKKYFEHLERAISPETKSNEPSLKDKEHISNFLYGYQGAEKALDSLEKELHKMDEFDK